MKTRQVLTLKSQIAEGHKSAALEITRERLNLLRSGSGQKQFSYY